MKLIKEINETVNYVTEDANGKKELHIEGPFLVAEKKNRNGSIVCAAVVYEGKEFLVLTTKGKMVRMSVEDFRSKGKTTVGNKIVGLDTGDKVQTLVVVDKATKEETI